MSRPAFRAAMFAALLLLAGRLLFDSRPADLAVAAAPAYFSALIWQWRGRKSAEKFCIQIDRARRGEIEFDELARSAGLMGPVVPAVGQMLAELSQLRVEIGRLKTEMRERIAGRTDALQRKIGSLQLQAMRDPLTSLLNRRALEHELPRILEQHRSEDLDFCLLMVDVDHFKLLNDTLGHAAGDEVLVSISQIIRSTMGAQDFAFRYGGDEFVLVLTACEPGRAQALGDRLESLVDALVQPMKLKLKPRLAIGICARSENPTASAHQMMELADKRLYGVKADRKINRRAS